MCVRVKNDNGRITEPDGQNHQTSKRCPTERLFVEIRSDLKAQVLSSLLESKRFAAPEAVSPF